MSRGRGAGWVLGGGDSDARAAAPRSPGSLALEADTRARGRETRPRPRPGRKAVFRLLGHQLGAEGLADLSCPHPHPALSGSSQEGCPRAHCHPFSCHRARLRDARGRRGPSAVPSCAGAGPLRACFLISETVRAGGRHLALCGAT